FNRASQAAKERQSPTPLREYLAREAGDRHLVEALEQIDEFYDKALADLAERARLHPDKIDKQLLDAMRILLNGLRRAGTATVTVGFDATEDDAPKEKLYKDLEEREYKQYLDQFPAIKAMHTDKRTAILPRGMTFDPAQSRRREGMILERLRQAV